MPDAPAASDGLEVLAGLSGAQVDIASSTLNCGASGIGGRAHPAQREDIVRLETLEDGEEHVCRQIAEVHRHLLDIISYSVREATS